MAPEIDRLPHFLPLSPGLRTVRGVAQRTPLQRKYLAALQLRRTVRDPMFAIIEESGRQFRVAQNELVNLDYREGAEAGQEIRLERVLLANGGGASVVGKPIIANAIVAAKVVTPEDKGPKLYIQKFRRRKNSRRRTGHRQKYTTVRITSIDVPGLEIKSEAPAAE